MAELMKQGRRRVAELMSREINSGSRVTRRLASVLDTLLKSDDGEFDDEKADWCFWLMAGGDTPEDFLKILQQNNTSSVCGLVWNAHFVAYRCRDCAISPCMSLCADCFQNGNHEGHDFNMFRSQAGGACDCGDENVMRKQGFCTSHGSERKRQTILIPDQMLTSAKFIIPRLILKIYDDLQMARSEHEIYRLPEKLPQLLKFLSKISEADILRDIIGQAILSPIDELISLASNHVSASIKLQPTKPTSPTSGPPLPHGIPHNMMQVAGTDFPIPASSAVPNYISDEEPDSLDCTSSRSESATSSIKIEGTFVTFLDFLMHILVKSEFASSLATFMLQLLPDPSYKVAFTRSFCRHYSAIGKSLCQSVQPEKLSNNLVHVSVQLFSSDVLAKLMVHEENALHTLVTVLIDMINSCATIMPYEATPAGDSDLCLTTVSIPVACCRNFILSKHCYWPITSDLINVLSHKDIVEIFLNDDALIEQWMTLVKLVTAMNRNRRELLTHLEFEPSTYITSFSVEFESVVAVMWELVRGCVKLNDKGIYCVKMIRATEKALQQWYSVVPFMPKKIDLTFHLALHRYLALFVSQAINRFGVDEKEALPSADLLAKWMEYPLRALVGCNEIKCGLWVYNGYQIRGQAQSYVQCHFCNSMIDLDIFFVQMAASKLDPDYFLILLIERFSLNSWFHFGKLVASDSKLSNLEKEKQTAEGFLSFILTLLSQRVFSGASDLEQCKKDLSALLCVANKTHSQLHETIPSKPGESSETTQNFEIALREMADFQAPTLDTDKMQQGTYTPKDIVWDDSFDYSHIQLRCYSTPDHQTALERYTNNMQQRGLTTHAHCWPPMKNLSPVHPAFKGLYRILQSDVLHKILVFVIHRAVTSINDVTEPMLITVVHLLQLAVRYPSATISKGFIPPVETTDRRTRNLHKCLDFLEKHAKDRKMLYGTSDRELLELNKNLYDRMIQGHEISSESSIEDVVTILQHEVFSHRRNSVLLILLSYTNKSFFRKEVAKTYFDAHPVKALESFLSVESQETYQLLKRLFGHWKKCSELDGVEITDYAFVKQRAQQEKEFSQIMTLFVDNYDVLFRFEFNNNDSNAFRVKSTPWCRLNVVERSLHQRAISDNYAFQIRDTPPNTPATVFDIEYDAASIVENSSKSVCGKIQRIDTASASSEEAASNETQENLISLLAQLLARLSQGSKNTPCKKLRENETLKEPIAGDGSYHVTELLVSLAEANRVNEQLVNRLCPSISERNCVKKKRGDSEGDNQSYKEDRRKRAMARQQKILAEFMSKQEVFRDQVIAQDLFFTSPETNMEGVEEGDTQTSRMDESYDCVICGQASPSTYDRPIGVATLMQPTTVLSKRRRESDYHELPDQKNESEYQTSGVLLEKRKKAITQTFDGVAAARSLEVGLDCGVFVQTCCHYIHIDCHQSYIKSLQEERSRSFGYENNMFDITKGFFTCPLCRQPCNGVVPILPDVLRKRDSKQAQKDFLESAIDVTKLLQKYSEPGSMSLLTAKALEFTVLTASSATFVTSLIIALRRDGHPSTSIYANRTIKEKFVILISTFRSCLELEYINICNESRTLGSKRSCLAVAYRRPSVSRMSKVLMSKHKAFFTPTYTMLSSNSTC
eukprot:gene3219-3696_t